MFAIFPSSLSLSRVCLSSKRLLHIHSHTDTDTNTSALDLSSFLILSLYTLASLAQTLSHVLVILILCFVVVLVVIVGWHCGVVTQQQQQKSRLRSLTTKIDTYTHFKLLTICTHRRRNISKQQVFVILFFTCNCVERHAHAYKNEQKELVCTWLIYLCVCVSVFFSSVVLTHAHKYISKLKYFCQLSVMMMMMMMAGPPRTSSLPNQVSFARTERRKSDATMRFC